MVAAIEIVSLNLVYPFPNGEPISALRDIHLTIAAGQLVGLLGSDGAGKSSLLGVIAGQLEPATGCVRVNGFDVVTKRETARQQIVFSPDAALRVPVPPILLLDEPDKLTAWRAQAQARQCGQALLLATPLPSLIAELCERVVILEKGHLVIDGPASALQRVLSQQHYKIRVRGRLPLDWSDWFSGLDILVDGADTVLDGCLPDQGALHSVLNAISTLNLPLLNVEYIEPDVPTVIDRLGRLSGADRRP